jgi:hypothetical protein
LNKPEEMMQVPTARLPTWLFTTLSDQKAKSLCYSPRTHPKSSHPPKNEPGPSMTQYKSGTSDRTVAENPHMDVLIRIKRAVLAGRYSFGKKARIEMETDDLTELDIAESILNARDIYKKLRSTSPSRNKRREYLYVIQGTNLDGLVIYTKGKLVEAEGTETYYFLVSSKRAM